MVKRNKDQNTKSPAIIRMYFIRGDWYQLAVAWSATRKIRLGNNV